MLTVRTNIGSTMVLLSVEDDLRWKTTFSGSNLWQRTTFNGRPPSVEDDLKWKMTFGGR